MSGTHPDGALRRERAMFLKKLYRVFRDAVFPARCMCCRSLFIRDEEKHGLPGVPMAEEQCEPAFHRLLSPFLCENCLPEFQAIESPLCPRCGMMFRERVSDDHLCGDCLTGSGHVGFARAMGVYERSLMHVIRAFKYRGKTQLAKPLGRMLFHLYARCYGEKTGMRKPPDLIMPVPLHKKRFRERGFNQAYLLVREWPGLYPLAHAESPRVTRDGFVRKRWTRPQAGLDRKDRRANIKGAFALSPTCDVQGKRILLVDDVYTTGATAEECARVLLNGGASEIDILTLSRTM